MLESTAILTSKAYDLMFLDQKSNPEDSSDTLGGRIVTAREAQELTTSQLARRLGVTSTTMRAWETDSSEPRSNRLINLAGVLNVSPSWLLTGLGERPSDSFSGTEIQNLQSSIQRIREQAALIIGELDDLESRLEVYESYVD
jgi:transcriptional regulator with XRE-family HTH domain